MIAIKQNIMGMRLGDVPEDKVFWCCDGKVFRNLKDLALALEGMADEIYLNHASGNKNDFSKWVNDVIGDVTLSHQLKKARSRITAARRVKDRLEWLKTRA